MPERTVQQMELELDAFWNDLVSGNVAEPPQNSDEATVLRLAQLGTATGPGARFFDTLWSDLVTEARPPAIEENRSPLPDRTAPPVVLPIFPPQPARGRLARWGKPAAAIAALLAIVLASALLIALRQRDDVAVPAASRWSMIGGGPQRTNANPESSPIADPVMRWRFETDGRIEGAPVISAGVVYIGNQEHHFYAIDAETGLQRWEANLRKPVTGTAAIGDGVVVVGTTSTLFGLDAETGQPRWQRQDLVAASDPLVVGDAALVIDADRRIHSVLLMSGEDRWTSAPLESAAALAVDENHALVVASTTGGTVLAYSIGDGTQLWKVELGVGALGVPVIDGTFLVIPYQGGMIQMEGATGEIVKTYAVAHDGIPSLALAGNQLVATTDITLISYDSESLKFQWTNPFASGLTGGLSLGSSSIYIPGSDRTLTAIERTTGEVQWTLTLDEVAQVAPALTSDGLFISTRSGSVYAFGNGSPDILAAPSANTGAEIDGPAKVIWKSSGGPNALKNPTGIAVSPTGEIWVCDTANDRLQIFDSGGNFLREFGSHGSAPGQFDFGEETAEMDGNLPLGHHCSLAFDASGALYVADAANFRVQRFPASAFDWMMSACCAIRAAGTEYPFPGSAAQPDLIIGKQGNGSGEFLFASDVAVAPNGDIFVGDRHRLDVQRFDANGVYQETIGSPVSGDALAPKTFISIDGMAVDQAGRLYVVDDEPQRVNRIERDGTWTVAQLPRRDYRINGIAVDSLGNLFVAQIDSVAGSFWIYDSTGAPLAQVGSFGSDLGQFDGPAGVALDGQGNVYVTDWAMGRLQKFEIDYDVLKPAAPESG